jgi:hypothetical protein
MRITYENIQFSSDVSLRNELKGSSLLLLFNAFDDTYFFNA